MSFFFLWAIFSLTFNSSQAQVGWRDGPPPNILRGLKKIDTILNTKLFLYRIRNHQKIEKVQHRNVTFWSQAQVGWRDGPPPNILQGLRFLLIVTQSFQVLEGCLSRTYRATSKENSLCRLQIKKWTLILWETLKEILPITITTNAMRTQLIT